MPVGNDEKGKVSDFSYAYTNAAFCPAILRL